MKFRRNLIDMSPSINYRATLWGWIKTIKSMKIDFNNVRIQTCREFESLCKALNESEEYEGYMLVDPNDIQKQMDFLRTCISSIAMTFEDGRDDFKNVFLEEYLPGEKMASFDWESEENKAEKE